MMSIDSEPPGNASEDEMDLEMDDELLAAIAAAEAAIGSMAEDYPELLKQDVAALEDAARRLAEFAPGEDAHANAAGEAFGILHDIKGQAASFGFEPATRLSDPLCECLRQVNAVNPVLVGHLRVAALLLGRMAEDGTSPQINDEVEALIGILPVKG